MVVAIILALLVTPWIVLTAVGRLAPGLRVEPARRGLIGLALVFGFTGVGHFIKTAPMSEMLPPSVPARVAIIWITGVLELAAAVGLLIPRLTRITGICLILFLIGVLPANLYAAFQHVEMGGHGAGPVYLLVRLPLQLVLIGWTWWFALRRGVPRD